MKRLRTLSVSDIDALNRRNRKIAWGQSYWYWVNLRKSREQQHRVMRSMAFVIPVGQIPAPDQLPGEHPIQEPTKH